MRHFAKGLAAAVLGIAAGLGTGIGSPAYAADHGDAPTAAGDQALDLGDTYVFLDPNDNKQIIILGTTRGFIAAGENSNFGVWDNNVRFRFEIENTDDAKPDLFIDIRFSKRVSTTAPQVATITLPGGKTFTAPVTNPSLAPTPNEPTVTTRNGVSFFAGQVDDPFFFDIPAFSRFAASVKAGAPDASQLTRGRDSFAGYNIMGIALRMPLSRLKGDNSDFVGVNFVGQRRLQEMQKNGNYKLSGKWRTIDRAGIPAVNAVLIPYGKRDLFNATTGAQDAAGRFVPDILATLEPFGTDDTSIGILASIAVTKGDQLRMDVRIPNTGDGGGSNPQAAFPNGRRLQDDVVDTLLTVINNRNAIGDSVDSNDVTFRNQFPFFAPAQQPRSKGVIDDNTRN